MSHGWLFELEPEPCQNDPKHAVVHIHVTVKRNKIMPDKIILQLGDEIIL
jgi:hypothetical protein